MKMVLAIAMCLSSSMVFAQSKSVELSKDSAQKVGSLVRAAHQVGDKSVSFIGGPNVTQYNTEGLECYFQNSDDSVSCSVK